MSILGLYTYEDDDPGACYSCGATWLPDEGEWHRKGCQRIEHPAGGRVRGTCFECGAPEYGDTGLCSNEGGCRRWGDPGAIFERFDVEPIPYGELVAATRERQLDDLPF